MPRIEDLQRIVDETTAGAPSNLDLTSAGHLQAARDLADTLLAADPDVAALRSLEKRLVSAGDTKLLGHLATKLALSRALVTTLPGPLHLSVVFAVYKEHQRILPATEVLGGEDFLVRKVEQLEWLAAGREDFGWDLTIVDDGCPEGSGDIAERLAAARGWSDRVQVLRLVNAIAKGLDVVRPLTDTSQSMKGGAVALGLWSAAQVERENHVVVFTDADLSTHLGQTGLLLEPILGQGREAAIGSRREPSSVVVKQGVRNTRGKLFIYLWKRVIGVLPDIVDTQCGFKGFRADVVRDIVTDLLEKKFAFDIEMLIKTRLRGGGGIERVPIAWIDSEVLSTTTDLQPYLPMLQSMVGMYRRYLEPDPTADAFAAFVEDLDETSWGRLLETIPAAIADGDPQEFGEFDGVTVDELRGAAGI